MTANAKRSCGPCSACCVALSVDSPAGCPGRGPEWIGLAKPTWTACPHLGEGVGCAVYAARPGACRDFRCAWLDGLADEGDRPDAIGVVVYQQTLRPGLTPRWPQGLPVATFHEVRPDAAERGRGRALVARLAKRGTVCLILKADGRRVFLGPRGHVQVLADSWRVVGQRVDCSLRGRVFRAELWPTGQGIPAGAPGSP